MACDEAEKQNQTNWTNELHRSIHVILGGTALLLAGCATAQKGIVLGTVGPDPTAVVAVTSGNGSLLVFSAYEVNADFNSRDPHRPELCPCLR